ncbi:cystatin-like [Trachemys scripta elegans]|uniref:cystatin-like n=1 Tax=Trachemys scripta elegans TaxID=31138 RepID=UPI0015541DBF|nr:cystatin-like [Trachemys scripta elegans]
MWVGPSQGVGPPAYILAPHPQLWPLSAMAFPAAVAGPWLCLLLLLGVPLTLGASIPGGLHNVSVSDPEVQQAAQVAVKTYNDRNNCIYYSKGLQVLSAQRQVVSRIVLYLTMEMVQTLCTKNQGGVVDPNKCPLPPPSQQMKVRCNFQIWSQPWLMRTEIKFRCNSGCH